MAKRKFPGKGHTVGEVKRHRGPQGGLRGWLKSGANLIANTAPSIAAAFAESGTQTVTKTKRVPIREAGSPLSSFSAYTYVRSKKIPTKYEGMAVYKYSSQAKSSTSNTQKFQKFADIACILDRNSMAAILNAHPIVTTDIAVDKRQNTLEYFLRSIRSRTLFANTTNINAHCTLYNIRVREGTNYANSPQAVFADGLDDLENAATTDEQEWGIVPEMVPAFKNNFQVLNKESFTIPPGGEHLHTFNVKMNRKFSVEDLHLDETTTKTVMPGWSYYLCLNVFGGLVTEDATSTEVAIGVTRVNSLSTIQWGISIASADDMSTLVVAHSAQDTVTVPKMIYPYTGAETAPTDI